MQPTNLIYQRDGHLTESSATILDVKPVPILDEREKQLFKQATEADHVVITDSTIFHPQGGGQPSDVGTIENGSGVKFDVQAARMSAALPNVCLHFGRFAAAENLFTVGEQVTQILDAEKRRLFSRYHTAGHVLGAAVKHTVAAQVPNFDETKASHFPDSAACEFQGSIDGKFKDAIQAQVDAFVTQDLPVQIDWWDEDDFRANGLEHLIPDRVAMGIPDGEKFRVVKIVGAETYPCGGTHVDSTRLCGKTNVKKISRSKGTSRVGYFLMD